MESLYIKEKRLQSVLEKLKSISDLPNLHAKGLEQIYEEKNQLQSEKQEIEKKYNNLLLKFKDLKDHLKKVEEEQKKIKNFRSNLIKISMILAKKLIP